MPGNSNIPKGQMTPADASRIQSSNAKSGGDMSSGGFAARAQAAGARNDNASQQHGGSGQSQNQGKK
ncbi:hypothetical protein F5Y15DRAFT_354760 [Xylariaceae sp. FL0016]|nr:hypothetical protein F5Y15DRAFT_354760 [Xylariaceae sp. FL0016]